MFRKGLLRICIAQTMMLAICGLPLLASGAEPDYYTWVDENGVTNYAQKNPRDYDARHVSRTHRFGYVDTRRPQGSSTNTENATANEDAATTDKPAGVDPASIAAERKAIVEQIAAVKKSNCELGKRNLAQLEAYRRIRVRDADGNETLLNDEEKNDRMNEARQIIQENCTG